MDDVYKAAVSGQAALLFNHGMIILLMDLSITLRRNIYMIYAIIYSKNIYIYIYIATINKSQEVKLQIVTFYKGIFRNGINLSEWSVFKRTAVA
jgi:hypothetical protein